jgi:hypothetical protein
LASARFSGRAPRVVRLKDEGDWWFCDGHKIIGASAGAQAGRRFETPDKLSRSDLLENVRPGGYLPEAQVKDMQADGVDAAIVYPTVGLLLFGVPNSELRVRGMPAPVLRRTKSADFFARQP